MPLLRLVFLLCCAPLFVLHTIQLDYCNVQEGQIDRPSARPQIFGVTAYDSVFFWFVFFGGGSLCGGDC